MSGDKYFISNIPGKGRGLRAVNDLQIGEEIFIENANCFVVKATYFETHCFNCIKPLESSRVCQGCNTVSFCDDCANHKTSNHEAFCQMIPHLKTIATIHSVDLNLLFFLGKALCTPHIQEELTDPALPSETETENIVELSKRSDAEDNPCETSSTLFRLETNRNSATLQWHDAIFKASQALLKLTVSFFPLLENVDPESLVRLALIINNNAHGLRDISGKNRDIGFGVFPLAAIINHSCYPNVAFIGGLGGRLVVRSIRKIPKHEELCFSYIDPYQPRSIRQDELEATKHFACQCERCSEPFSTSCDRYINGLLCQSAECRNSQARGILLPPGLLDDSNSSTNILAAVLKGASLNVDLKVPLCDMCGTPSSVAYVQDTLRDARELLVGIEKASQDTTSSPTLIKEMLDMYVARFSTILHPYHSLMLRLKVLLLQNSKIRGDLKEACKYCGDILRMLRLVHPANHAEIGDYFYLLGKLYAKSGNVAKATKALQKCIQIRRNCCGENHTSTRYAINLLESLVQES